MSAWWTSSYRSGSTWTTGFNKLCGINPDQHFYIHLDKEVSADRSASLADSPTLQVGFQHVDFTITSVTKNVPYKFGLWITQIDCFDGTSVMAPGVGDFILQFNFIDTHQSCG